MLISLQTTLAELHMTYYSESLWPGQLTHKINHHTHYLDRHQCLQLCLQTLSLKSPNKIESNSYKKFKTVLYFESGMFSPKTHVLKAWAPVQAVLLRGGENLGGGA
jgi:hypothetical protein